MRSWDTTTIPSSPTRPGCRPIGCGPGLDPRTRSLHLAEYLDRIDNTVQYSWLLEIARTFHGFAHDRIDPQTIDDLYDRALAIATARTGTGRSGRPPGSRPCF